MAKRKRKNDPADSGLQVPAPSKGVADENGDIQRLRQENEALRKQLVEVLANASENEKIWRHFAAVERILFRTRELDRLIEELLREIKERFQAGLLVLYLSHPEALERFFQGEAGDEQPDRRQNLDFAPGRRIRARPLWPRPKTDALFDREKRLSPDALREWPYPALRCVNPAKNW